MEKYIWLFPVLFIFHDMEEIIGFGIWSKKNKDKLNKVSGKFYNIYENMFSQYSTEGMALAVFEILVLCIVICITAQFFNFYALWLGTFIAYIIHMFVHIVQAILMKGYIPAVATSLIAIPLSIAVLLPCLSILNYKAGKIIFWTIIGLALVMANVKLAHAMMHWFTVKMQKWL